MAAKKLTGEEKAAIILNLIGEDNASEVIKHLDVAEVRRIGNFMAQKNEFSAESVEETVKDFFSNAASEGITIGGEDYVKKILTKALGEEKAGWIVEHLTTSPEEGGLENLKWMEAKMIAEFLKKEYAQTIALILTQLPSIQSAEVLGYLPDNLRNEVVIRIASMEAVSPAMIREIDIALKQEFQSSDSIRQNVIGGINAAAEILNNMGKDVEFNILSHIEGKQADLANQIRESMFVFEDLIAIDDRGIQEILKEVKKEDLIKALKSANEELREKILKNMSSRAADLLREDLQAMGPIKLKEVQKVQQDILKIARKLEAEGKITIAGKGEEVLV